MVVFQTGSVQQGSVLGSLLCVIYINVQSMTSTFADDTNIGGILDRDNRSLQRHLDQLGK